MKTVAKASQITGKLDDYIAELPGRVIVHEGVFPTIGEVAECQYLMSQSKDICKPSSWIFYRPQEVSPLYDVFSPNLILNSCRAHQFTQEE